MANLGFVGRETLKARSAKPMMDETRPAATSSIPAQLKSPYRSLWGSLVAFALFVIFLLVWEYANANHLISSLFYPRPTVIGKTLVNWFSTTNWQPILLPTLQ